MSTPLLRYDFSFMLADQIGRAGKMNSEFPVLCKELETVQQTLLRQMKSESAGFFTIPDQEDELHLVQRMARDIKKQFQNLIVVGIGGSDLGARAICRALTKKNSGMQIFFIGANTDPEEIGEFLDRVDLKKSAINIISKSGDTIEPMSTFLFLRDRLIKKVGVKKHRSHVIATTDAHKGTLRRIAEREGYRTLPVPENIGGRFSSLTTVGLFPAACAGVAIKDLLDGAREMREIFIHAPVLENIPLLFAGLHHDAYKNRGQHISVLMPYANSLKEFAEWFRQLWAESLGKKMDRAGKVVTHGLTPLAALGATDQHSQIQLYNEGPFDKLITFIQVETCRANFVVPNAYPDIEGIAYMAGHSFEEIIHAEREATAKALAKNGRPNGTLFIPKITPQTIGSLMFFFMLTTAVMGELLDIDAYDQPGVEEGKRMMYALLGRK